MGDLVLDTKAGLRKAVDGKLIKALQYTDAHLQMPPSGKLPQPVIDSFEAWAKAGAFDPRVDSTAATPAPLRGMSVSDGRFGSCG